MSLYNCSEGGTLSRADGFSEPSKCPGSFSQELTYRDARPQRDVPFGKSGPRVGAWKFGASTVVTRSVLASRACFFFQGLGSFRVIQDPSGALTATLCTLALGSQSLTMLGRSPKASFLSGELGFSQNRLLREAPF